LLLYLIFTLVQAPAVAVFFIFNEGPGLLQLLALIPKYLCRTLDVFSRGNSVKPPAACGLNSVVGRKA
jgi:hypothetical protein